MGTSCTKRSLNHRSLPGGRTLGATGLLALVLTALAAVITAPPASAAGGDLLWAKRYGTAVRPAWTLAVAAAPHGAVCVAGDRIGPTGVHMVLLRYRANGRRTWVRQYGATRSGEEFSAAVACDRRGNVVVAGYAERGLNDWDIVVIKYSPGGKRLWLRRYTGGAGGDADATAVAVDRYGNVYVTGTVKKPGGDTKVVTVKYSPSGKRRWTAVRGSEVLGGGFALPGVGFTVAGSALDTYGNVYVCGTASWMTDERAVVMKFKRGDGRTPWARVDTPALGEKSRATAIAVRGNLVVASVSLVAGSDSHMGGLGYSRGGAPRYRTFYDEGPSDRVESSDVIVDAKGRAFVAGVASLTMGTQARSCVMRLLADGTWQSTAAEPLDGDARDLHLALGPAGAVYLAWADQWMDGATERRNIVVRRFSNSLNTRPWIKVWRGPGHDNDRPCGVVLGTTGGLYVAGTCRAASDQIVVLKLRR